MGTTSNHPGAAVIEQFLDEGLQISELGDVGAALDATARQQYQDRLRKLQNQMDDAIDFNDVEQVAKIQQEMEFIAAELNRATGLGGRAVAAASAQSGHSKQYLSPSVAPSRNLTNTALSLAPT